MKPDAGVSALVANWSMDVSDWRFLFVMVLIAWALWGCFYVVKRGFDAGMRQGLEKEAAAWKVRHSNFASTLENIRADFEARLSKLEHRQAPEVTKDWEGEVK